MLYDSYMNKENYRTPGQLIEALMAERNWNQKFLAIISGIDQSVISRIITNKKAVDAEIALRLNETFNVPAEDFLAIQAEYDLAKARITARPDPLRATRAHLFGDLPITEMIQRGWLEADDIKDTAKVEAALTKFFGVTSVDDIEILPHSAKKTNTFTQVTPSQLAWLYRVRQIANEMIVNKYSPSIVKNALPLLTNLLASPEEARKVPKILAECGIRYVVVESLSSAKIDGACFWLNDLSPVIGMSLRYDRIDNFWFVLRHELEHVVRRHGITTMMVDAELEGEHAGTGANIASEERVANIAASEFCVPQKKMDSLIARKSPFFHEHDIIGMARSLQIHPGLIAGQLQHRIGKYDLFRKHLVKIRHNVTPNSMVDGWGNVAPVD
jgi:HTH-type transcriptional regulator / antitoxin HigA